MSKIYADVRRGSAAGGVIQVEIEDADIWNEKIRDLREKIAFKLDDGTVPEDLRIFFAGKEMEDGKRLCNYNTKKESTLRVTVKCDGTASVAAGGAASSSARAGAARSASRRSKRVSVKLPGNLGGGGLDFFCPPGETIGDLKGRIEDETSYPAKAQILMPSCDCENVPAARRQRLADGSAAGRGQEIGDPLPNSCEVTGAGLCTPCGGMVLRLTNPNGGKSKAIEKLVFVEAFCGKAGQQPGKVEAKPVWVPVQGTEAAMFKALEHGRERDPFLHGTHSSLFVVCAWSAL